MYFTEIRREMMVLPQSRSFVKNTAEKMYLTVSREERMVLPRFKVIRVKYIIIPFKARKSMCKTFVFFMSS